MPTPIDPQQLWKSQVEEDTEVPLEFIRYKAQEFQKRIRNRNRREYVGIVFGTILYCGFMWFLPGLLVKIGAALTLAAMYYSVYQIHRDGSAAETPAEATAGECVDFHLGELIRQRDMLRRVGPWHVGPMIPGLLLFYAGAWIENVSNTRSALVLAGAGILAAAVIGGVYWANVRAADNLQEEIDALTEI